ncbi:hypothetical protein ACLKA7_009126 [Drosophila subpalustris]
MCFQPGLISLLLISLLFGLPGCRLTATTAEKELKLEQELKMDEDTARRQLQTEPEAMAISKSLSILKSDTINDNTFHRSQSKRAATLAKSQPLISATTQITKPNDERKATATTTTAATSTMSTSTATTSISTNSSMLNAVAAPSASSLSSINNISNNGDQRRWTTVSTMAPSEPGVTAGLQANLIMSNRNVEEQKLDEHEYKITHNNIALFVPSSDIYSNNNQLTATTFGVAEASQVPATASTDEATTTSSTTTTTKTSTTTRRPAPRTTLKPPPTIDDYQTIISQAGTHAYLPCNVKQLVKKPISWLRMRDGHILTVDQTTFIADQRFQSVFSPNPERWSLQIKYVQLKDEGTYECQVSTEPKASAIVHLRIVVPKTELIGESTRHVKAGSQVKLRCIISQALEPPLFINWFYNQKQIYLHNRRGWRTEIERIDLPTEVPTTSTVATTTTRTSTSTTSTSTSASTAAATATPAETLNDIAAITRSYILDAIAVADGTSMAGYGYVLPTTATPMHTAGTKSTPTAAAAGGAVAAGIATAAAATAADTPAILTLPATAAATTTATTTPEAATTTTTTTEPSTTSTTTTMLPSSSFIKQITTASLIIPAVVKLDSGNYTCSPSNSAPRTIVLHVLNGEYSASAIKSASVSWNTLIGCPGYLRWPNVSTILTLLWIIKFVLASNVTTCCNRGRNKVNNRPALQESATPATPTTTAKTRATTRITAGRTTTSSSRKLSTQSQSKSQTTTRWQRRFGLDCGCDCCCCGGDCGHVSSSISGTKVAEDKT